MSQIAGPVERALWGAFGHRLANSGQFCGVTSHFEMPLLSPKSLTHGHLIKLEQFLGDVTDRESPSRTQSGF